MITLPGVPLGHTVMPTPLSFTARSCLVLQIDPAVTCPGMLTYSPWLSGDFAPPSATPKRQSCPRGALGNCSTFGAKCQSRSCPQLVGGVQVHHPVSNRDGGATSRGRVMEWSCSNSVANLWQSLCIPKGCCPNSLQVSRLGGSL